MPTSQNVPQGHGDSAGVAACPSLVTHFPHHLWVGFNTAGLQTRLDPPYKAPGLHKNEPPSWSV